MTSPAFLSGDSLPCDWIDPAAVPAAARGFSAGFCAGDPLHAAGQKRYGMAGKEAMFLLPALRLYAVVPAARRRGL